MKITHYTESLNEGGIASFLAGLTPAQARTNDISICTIFKNYSIPTDLEGSGVKVQSLCKPSTILSYFYFPFLIFNQIRASDSDIIHIHCSFVYYIIAIFLLHKKKCFFYTVHSDAFQEKNSSKIESIIWPIKKYCFKKQWIVPITISQQSEESFYNTYGFHAKIIVNGIPLKVVDDSEEIHYYRDTPFTKVYVHAGRISEAKNQVAMCRAFNRIISDGDDAHLIIAGSVQDESIFLELKTVFNSRITYVGPRNDVLSMFRTADYMLLPSKWEGLPISLLEAMSQGCVPVCSPVGGIPSVVKHLENGILSDDYSEESIYATLKIANGLSDQEISQLAHNSELTAKCFSIEQTAINYLQYYQDIKIGK